MDEQMERVARALDWMEQRLSEAVSLDEVARRAGMSRYHFHRVFLALTGETVGAYLRRRRLSVAARALVDSVRPILEIALDAQFESQEAFTRAFKAQFEITPARLRAAQRVGTKLAPRLTLEDLRHRQEGVTMEPTYKEVGALTLVGLGLPVQDDGPKPNPEISALWTRFIARLGEISGMLGRQSYGVCLPVHPDVPLGEGDGFVYVSAVAVDASAPVPEGMLRIELAPARYAVFTHRGHMNAMGKTLSFIWGTWLPAQGIKPSGPDFELCDERFHPDSDDSEFDIYIPV